MGIKIRMKIRIRKRSMKRIRSKSRIALLEFDSGFGAADCGGVDDDFA
jgi:hypothetical protein